ncbi:S-adenosyl-L-methionine-dependent methyltransferase [Piptocephalis cylindrospora]|uniref:S-adenosyl-L-methionine-dependent methyltransferase n=1 Tax=Piptocephalis cylindrospora TaxID=1907219 RepID=A0A4V1IXL9_9FUNG|nr:S-adenosyl-L-methionine-dependent methyltransferase [Piptocephalis cylindrospora]|eukprot:RKP11519.1 S-adenosyl-L-methionine-dependent methyltransferase [Piptocephalis cylindrospora]
MPPTSFFINNNNDSQKALHLAHVAVIGGLHLAPISSDARILDVGTGSGIWSIEMARSMPNSKVVGIDIINPPPYPNQPSNCLFTVCDATKRFPFPDHAFSFIHVCYFSLAVHRGKWKKFLEECRRITCPGGWIEIHATDYQYHRTGGSGRMVNWNSQMLLGKMNDAGYTQIQRQVYTHPLGSWSGPVGSVLRDCCKIRLNNLLVPVARFFLSPDRIIELENCITEMVEEANDMRSYYHSYTYVAQIPEDEAVEGIGITF